MTYSERLHIPWWWTLVGIGFAISIAVAVMAYVPVDVGIWFSVLLLAAVALALLSYGRTPLRVDAQGFQAGRYHISAEFIARAEGLDGAAAKAALGPEADHRAFLFTRPFVTSLVKIDLNDAADPHPYWLVSTRHPTELAAAIEAQISLSTGASS